ncbi:unnamed protein product [Ceutorhynchus assimilis]|uniref:CUB domain-containing protein n=1 Tax=Ceutorhynchus assimilis TaxID=467358 RepID=A0A9N9MKN4_9CUCU|nr:unnamed protein product [Ceutorhynchus assimilis]
MQKAKCILGGGTPIGSCGLIFVCCSFDTNCVKTTDKKQSYFKSGNLNSAVTGCQYRIKLRNKNVCQVRLDFEELTLAPAIQTTASTQTGSYYVFSCANDSLRINPNTFGVPVLCGNNTKQHLYIHVNQTSDPNSAVNIDINLADRLNEVNKYLPKPSWKIKFTQLECPLKQHKFDLSKFGEIKNINNDFNVLAPQGAIQYFTENIGEIRSIGYNTTNAQLSSYPYLEHYTIAFRRPSDVCGIKFTPSYFNMANKTVSNLATCIHYLYVPEYYSDGSKQLTGEKTSAVCFGKNPFYSLAPGPFYINVKTMNSTVTATTNQQGFLIDYELQTSCPYNNK